MPLQPMNFRKLDINESSPIGGALAQSIAQRLAQAQAEEKEAQVPYAGLTARANAASKLAYSNLMGPQFLSKIMEHPELLANIPEEQKKPLLDYIKSAALGQGTGNAMMGQVPEQQGKTIGQDLADKIMGLFGSKPQESAALAQTASVPANTQPQANYGYNPPANATPAQKAIEMAGAPGSSVNPVTSEQPKTFAKNAGEYQGIIAGEKGKREEQGKAAGKQISEYGDVYSGLVTQDKAINSLFKSLNNPVMSKIADTPFVNQKSMKWYEQSGTPEEKREMGLFKNRLSEVASSSFDIFKGKVTDRDLQFINSMKGSESDLIDTLKGKAKGLKLFTETKMKQIELAHEYMKQGMDKFDAEKKASNEIDTDAIENQINADVFPPPVRVRTPKGVIDLPKQGAMQLLRDHPENHEIVEAGIG